MNAKTLCLTSDIPENGVKGINLGDDAKQQDILILSRDGGYYAYKNSCPHTGVELNWMPDQFLDLDGYYIQCSVHGARFEPKSGLCVWGPCLNQYLQPIEIVVENGNIQLKE